VCVLHVRNHLRLTLLFVDVAVANFVQLISEGEVSELLVPAVFHFYPVCELTFGSGSVCMHSHIAQ
jgi:hypothetical protein